MSALMHRASRPLSRRLEPMTLAMLPEVLPIEVAAYEFPWTRGNFIDSLHAGYPAQVLRDEDSAEMLGYFIAMRGVDELHLLNLTVAPAVQRQGHAVFMLEALRDMARAEGMPQLWLEVRLSNERARQIYERFGFKAVGRRRAYYPAAGSRREDAIVMSLTP